MSAPLPSATSFEQLSHTRIVFLATILPPYQRMKLSTVRNVDFECKNE